ncbi:MAG: hypothetical protein NTX53_17920 [candidate division WOR-3 bacterium]|nr:hypothetical protein [candidate division WOR-3 bacterium]
MAHNDPTRRIANWDIGFDTARIKTVLDLKRPKMFEHVQAQIVSIVSMEIQVKQTCDAAGVSVIQYPFYLDFGRELWHITHETEMSGESAAKEAAVLITKWTARGLTQAVLQAIRTQVFNVAAPVAP